MVGTSSVPFDSVKPSRVTHWYELVVAAALTSTILIGLAVWARINYGSVGRCLVVWSGIRLYIAEPMIRFETLQEGKTYEAKVAIEYLGADPIQLIGFNSSCDCVAPGHFPVTLVGQSRYDLSINDTPKSDQNEAKLVRVFTSDSTTPELQIQVIAQAITPDPARVAQANQPDAEPILEPINIAPPGGR